jgi:histidinol-phosphatase (PHP family)
MPWANYHSHSLYCDGKAAPEDFIIAAVEKEFLAYGFSSHAPVPFPSRWNMKWEKLPEYIDNIAGIRQRYSGKIQVYTGLEIDYINSQWGYQSSGLKNASVDFIIGSVHYIGQFPDGSHFCFDGQPEVFFKGIEILYHNDFRKAVIKYYSILRGMVKTGVPDIIGHIDKIKMHNTVQAYFSEDEKWYVKEVDDTLELIARCNCIVEVNTRGLYKHDPPLMYPSIWVLERIYKKRIPIMLNSDSHHPDEIDLGFASTSSVLRDIGFKTLMVLYNGEWQEKPFNDMGYCL